MWNWRETGMKSTEYRKEIHGNPEYVDSDQTRNGCRLRLLRRCTFYPILTLFTMCLSFSLLSDWMLGWTNLRVWSNMATLKFLWIVLFFFPVLYYQRLYRLTFYSPLIIPFLQFKVPVYLFSSHTKAVSHWSSLLLFLHFPVLLYLFFSGGMIRVPLTIKDLDILWITEV